MRANETYESEVDMKLQRGTVLKSPFQRDNGYYLVLNPGDNGSLVIDIFKLTKDELRDSNSELGYEDMFIGSFHSKTLDMDFTFIPVCRPLPNSFLEDRCEDGLVGILVADDMRSFTLGMRNVMGGFLYRRKDAQRPNGWWTAERKEQFLQDCLKMEVAEISKKWDVSVNSVYALNTRFRNDLIYAQTQSK